MSEPNDPVCPECGTPRASDGTPDCSCARRASDARRDARAAERAAAEDFDPVRIRPFVELDNDATTDGEGAEPPQGPGDLTAAPAAILPLSVQEPASEAGLPDTGTRTTPRRRNRALLLTGAGATLAVLLTGAFLGGLFTYESPSRDGAVSDDVRAPVPDATTEDGTSPEGQSTAAVPSTSPSTSSSSSPSTPSGTNSPTPTATSSTPATPPSGTGPTPSTAPDPTDAEGQPPVLHRGDQGPEVVELQLRLRQIGLYSEEADGDFDRQLESAVRTYQLTRVILNDESGAYGSPTRTSLESETSEP
ncbi:peptidoglycan-binding domain-containing protein [Streptomyces sp. HUAS 31]|uniref:peptidoglycan-binding domain-containing protein n=1 Tax=Streptomyces sp. HUAS 31 TaxID=3020055 RepID=UPI0023052B9E|nr:peptidoglycan-binding domain-containing protein [Streptomyces sp. HUAS 31]WCD94775.1 peptidoglycan-binding domain-containing protein [Streptomyces sp. HUAS 31]